MFCLLPAVLRYLGAVGILLPAGLGAGAPLPHQHISRASPHLCESVPRHLDVVDERELHASRSGYGGEPWNSSFAPHRDVKLREVRFQYAPPWPP
jgi:hypothetical protein